MNATHRNLLIISPFNKYYMIDPEAVTKLYGVGYIDYFGKTGQEVRIQSWYLTREAAEAFAIFLAQNSGSGGGLSAYIMEAFIADRLIEEMSADIKGW